MKFFRNLITLSGYSGNLKTTIEKKIIEETDYISLSVSTANLPNNSHDELIKLKYFTLSPILSDINKEHKYIISKTTVDINIHRRLMDYADRDNMNEDYLFCGDINIFLFTKNENIYNNIKSRIEEHISSYRDYIAIQNDYYNEYKKLVPNHKLIILENDNIDINQLKNIILSNQEYHL